MSNDNDGLCATAEAFVYVAMTRSMMFFRAFHGAIVVEMLLAIAYVWWYGLSGRRSVGDRLRHADQRQQRKFPARRTARTSWRPHPAIRASSFDACCKASDADAGRHHLRHHM